MKIKEVKTYEILYRNILKENHTKQASLEEIIIIEVTVTLWQKTRSTTGAD